MSVSPLLYVGGKSRKVKIFSDILNDNFDLTDKTLISPFCGGSSFEIFMSKNMKVICCDFDKRLMAFWHHAKNNRAELIEKVKTLLPINREKFKQFFYKSFEDITSLERASLYYVLNRNSYCGKMTSINDWRVSNFEGFTSDKIDNLNNFDLNNIQFFLKDYKDTLLEYGNKDKVIFYLDPPYYIDYNKLYGRKGEAHKQFDHQELNQLLKRTNNNWVLSYNDSKEIREMYKDYKILDVPFIYSCGKCKKANELLIINFLTF